MAIETIDSVYERARNEREKFYQFYEVGLLWSGFIMLTFFLELIFKQLRSIEVEIIATRGKIN